MLLVCLALKHILDDNFSWQKISLQSQTALPILLSSFGKPWHFSVTFASIRHQVNTDQIYSTTNLKYVNCAMIFDQRLVRTQLGILCVRPTAERVTKKDPKIW